MTTAIGSLNTWGQQFVSFAWPMWLQSTALTAALLGLNWALRRRVRAVVRYGLLSLVLVKLLLPPSISLPSGVGYWLAPAVATTPAAASLVATGLGVILPTSTALPERVPPPPVQVAVESSPKPVSESLPQAIPEPAASVRNVPPAESPTWLSATSTGPALTQPIRLSWQALCLLAWLLGAVVLASHVLRRSRQVSRLVSRAQPASPELQQLLESCREHLDMRRGVGLRLVESRGSPAVCGFLRPVILVPRFLTESLAVPQLRAVLMHELGHLKRGDLWLNHLQTILQVVYWYNPLLWVANAVMRRVREQAVDELVMVQLQPDAHVYPATLLEVAKATVLHSGPSLGLVGIAESSGGLRERLHKLLHQPVPKSARLGCIGVTAVLVAAGLGLPMARGQAARKSTGGGVQTNSTVSDNFNPWLTGNPVESKVEQAASMPAASGPIERKVTTRRWVSPNGRHAVSVVETNTTTPTTKDFIRGYLVSRQVDTRVGGLSISPDGAASEQWQCFRTNQWVTSFAVASAMVADSGKLFVLLKVNSGTRPPPSLQRAAWPPEVVILDSNGQSQALVALTNWWQLLGQDDEVTADAPPHFRFLDNEKTLEIKLRSGKTVRVNALSGDLSVEGGTVMTPPSPPATSPSPAPAAPAAPSGVAATKLDSDAAIERRGIRPVEHKDLLNILEQESKAQDGTAMQGLVNRFRQYPKAQRLETAAYCLEQNKNAGVLLWHMGKDNQLKDERLIPYIIQVMPKLQGRDLMYAASAASYIPDIRFVDPLLDYVVASDYHTRGIVGGDFIDYSVFIEAASALKKITNGKIGTVPPQTERQTLIQEWRDVWQENKQAIKEEREKEMRPVAHKELVEMFAQADSLEDKNALVRTFLGYGSVNDQLETVAYVLEKGIYPDAFWALCQIEDKRLVPLIAQALQDPSGLKVLLAAELACQNPDPSLLPLLMQHGLESDYGRDYRYGSGRSYVSYYSVFGFTADAIHRITDGRIGSRNYSTGIKQETPEKERRELTEQWRMTYNETLKQDYE